MNNSDIKVSKLIANKLINAGFSENIFELSIFIMENFTKSDSSENSNDTPIEEGLPDLTSEDQEFASQEYIEESLEEDLDEDEDDRVARLKKLARNNLIKSKKGVSVRRVGAND
tara:strand:- start:485 stop:826 length:342 start_codon:yes stop_codon:yes gene_type:complete